MESTGNTRAVRMPLEIGTRATPASCPLVANGGGIRKKAKAAPGDELSSLFPGSVLGASSQASLDQPAGTPGTPIAEVSSGSSASVAAHADAPPTATPSP